MNKIWNAYFSVAWNGDRQLTREQHLNIWGKLGLKPTFQITTRKSVHTYLLFSEPVPIKDWEILQDDCNHFLGTDQTIKDAPRLMRLAGTWHTQVDISTGEVLEPLKCELINVTDNRYSFKEIRDRIPSKPPNPQPYPKSRKKPKEFGDNSQVMTEDERDRLLALEILDQHPQSDPGTGTYHDYREIACALKKVLGEEEAISIMSRHSPNRNWEQIIRSSTGDFGIGTLVRYVKDYVPGWTYPDWWKDSFPKGQKPTFYPDDRPNPQIEKAGKDGDRNQWEPLSEQNYQMGKIAKRGNEPIFEPQANFIFHVERILQSNKNGGGYILRIERLVNGNLVTHQATIDGNCCIRGIDFAKALNESLGVHLIINCRHSDLLKTLQVKIEEYQLQGKKLAKLADRHGCQSDGTWIFENQQLDKNGDPTTDNQSGWIFNSRLSTGDEHIPSPRLAEQDSQALGNLIKALFDFAGENFPQCLAFLGYAAMSTHFQTIIREEGAFPTLNGYGEPGGVKSIAAESAASLLAVNWAIDGTLSSCSESALYERLSSTGNMLTIYDDPPRDVRRNTNLEELFKRLFNAKPRVVRGNYQKPHSPIAITSNHVCGDDSAATRTRLIRIPFPKVAIKKEAWTKLREAQSKASGSLPDIIKIGYDREEIATIEAELLKYLDNAHVRIAKSIAQMVFYTEKVCKLGQFDFDFKGWAITNLCPSENSAEANQDSLQDFLDKTETLKGRAQLGEWCIKTVERDGEEFIAMALSEVWSLVDKEFRPPYSLSLIKSLIVERGGLLSQQRKFTTNRDIAVAYERNLLISNSATPPPQTNKRCVLIPMAIASTGSSQGSSGSNGSSQGSKNCYRYTSDISRDSGTSETEVAEVAEVAVFFHSKEKEKERAAQYETKTGIEILPPQTCYPCYPCYLEPESPSGQAFDQVAKTATSAVTDATSAVTGSDVSNHSWQPQKLNQPFAYQQTDPEMHPEAEKKLIAKAIKEIKSLNELEEKWAQHKWKLESIEWVWLYMLTDSEKSRISIINPVQFENHSFRSSAYKPCQVKVIAP